MMNGWMCSGAIPVNRLNSSMVMNWCCSLFNLVLICFKRARPYRSLLPVICCTSLGYMTTRFILYLCFIYGFAMLLVSVDVAKLQNIIGLHNWVELAKTAEMVDVGSGCFEVGWAGYRFVVNFKIEDHGKAERDY